MYANFVIGSREGVNEFQWRSVGPTCVTTDLTHFFHKGEKSDHCYKYLGNEANKYSRCIPSFVSNDVLTRHGVRPGLGMTAIIWRKIPSSSQAQAQYEYPLQGLLAYKVFADYDPTNCRLSNGDPCEECCEMPVLDDHISISILKYTPNSRTNAAFRRGR